jgi:hypothetical protein
MKPQANRPFGKPPRWNGHSVVAVWLDGVAEFETSNGERRRVAAGGAVLVEDVHGNGHISRHPPKGKNVLRFFCRTGSTRREAEAHLRSNPRRRAPFPVTLRGRR